LKPPPPPKKQTGIGGASLSVRNLTLVTRSSFYWLGTTKNVDATETWWFEWLRSTCQCQCVDLCSASTSRPPNALGALVPCKQ